MTKKFGIIGNPIKHSLSPVLHNYWFNKYNIDASYSLIDIEESDITKIIKKIKSKELNGINITLPYKQKIVPHIDILVNDAEVTSSVNTVYLNDQETVVGENTDVYGLQAAYLKELDKTSKKRVGYWSRRRLAFCNTIFTKVRVTEICITNRTKKNVFF